MKPTARRFSKKAVEDLLLSVPRLTDLLNSQAKALGVGMGIHHGGQPIASLWPIKFWAFCNMVRRSTKGQTACWESNRRVCRLCRTRRRRVKAGDFRLFRCHMGLVDLPAAIYIRRRLLGHLFLGQIRMTPMAKRQRDFLRRRFDRLALAEEGVKFSEFLRAYEDLRPRSLAEVRRIEEVLHMLAQAIGTMAEHVHDLRSVNELSAELSPIVDMETGLETLYRALTEMLDFDSGSVWLASPEAPSHTGSGYSMTLSPTVLHWFGEPEDHKLRSELRLSREQGLGGMIAKLREPLILSSEKEMKRIPPVYSRHRPRRRLRSFAGVPVVSHGSLLGVLEVGAKRRHHFTTAERALLEAVGGVGATFIRRTRERGLLAGMNRQRSEAGLFSYLETELPLLFGSLAASVYVPKVEGGKHVLAPVFPDRIVPGMGPGGMASAWTPDYDLDAGEGLTGWAGKYRVNLRLDDCTNEREILDAYNSGRFKTPTGRIPPKPPAWAGKTRAKTELGAPNPKCPILICPSLGRRRRLLAVVRICEREGGPFTDGQMEFAKHLSEQLAICLESLSEQKKETERFARESLGRVISAYAHDFNRSIFLTKTWAEAAHDLAVQRGLDPAPFTKTCKSVSDLSQKLGMLVEATRSGKRSRLIVHTKRVDIVGFLRDLVAEHRSRSSSGRTRFSFRSKQGCGNAVVRIDPDEMRSCVDGILTNAVESIAKARRREGKVRVTCERLTGRRALRIRFEDNGLGFDKHTLDRVNRGMPPARGRRAGLGISLQGSKSFVETSLEGTFAVTNRAASGACVEWTVPLRRRR